LLSGTHGTSILAFSFIALLGSIKLRLHRVVSVTLGLPLGSLNGIHGSHCGLFLIVSYFR
jgi:hypothetical protein